MIILFLFPFFFTYFSFKFGVIWKLKYKTDADFRAPWINLIKFIKKQRIPEFQEKSECQTKCLLSLLYWKTIKCYWNL